MSETTTSRFWNYLSNRLAFEAPLHNWRMTLGDQVDFEKFRKTFLIPTDGFTESIICPKPCERACPRRIIKQYHDKGYEAVCRKWENDYFAISEQEILIYALKDSALLPTVASPLGISPDIVPFRTMNHAWKLGVLPIKSTRGIPAFFTLRNREHEVLDLILNLNRMVDGRYLLLGMNRQLLKPNGEQLLTEHGAKYIPLNETLDFNRETELTLMQPLDLAELVSSSSEPADEPENIFRKCGDVWEIRFQGGDKFLLSGVDTGAKYIHFLLERPGTKNPVVEIVSKLSFADSEYDLSHVKFPDGKLNGVSIENLPVAASGLVADRRAVEQYRNEAQQLLRDLDGARNAGEHDQVVQLQADIDTLTKLITEAVSPQGHERRLNDPVRSVESAFRNAINRAIRKIRKHDAALAVHLEQAIQCGMNPVYSLLDGIEWYLSPPA